uniref:Uncharacterized protein n=1 Tax=Arcella intermedia TaxID=1963864 RepID=A0A6B2L1Y4_9EUKA
MGRSKGFKKDRMYITKTEWVNEWGGKKAEREKRLPKTLQFYCCNLSLQPWTDPVCTSKGTIYDLLNIIPWVKKHKVDPVTGEPLKSGDLITLNFSKNNEGKFHCPITYKEFTDFTHIVAIKTSGNVYSYEAVENLNIKPKCWKDLISEVPFTKADIIHLQDPNDNTKKEANTYFHVLKGLTPGHQDDDKDPLKNITLTSTSEKIFREIRDKERVDAENKKKQEEEDLRQGIIKPPKPVGPQYVPSDSASFTSSSYTPKTELEETFTPKKTSQKGFVTLVTNMGNLNLQIHCDQIPLASENFITLCERKFYNNTIFHRNIRHFMIQGGDPTATGKGGKSMWGRDFPDEIVPELKHDGAGVLSMANCGRNTNSSEFFILYKSAHHLDGRHTVFGKLVGGMDVLKAMALVQTNEHDRPLQDIVILDTVVYLNPFCAEEMEKEKLLEEEKKKKEKEKKEFGLWLSNPQPVGSMEGSSIGKYLGSRKTTEKKTQKRPLDFGSITQSTNKKLKTSSNYGNFSNFG